MTQQEPDEPAGALRGWLLASERDLERAGDPAEPVGAPVIGKQTLISDAPAEYTEREAGAFFERAMGEARAQVATLERAITRSDRLAAVTAEGSLRRSLRTARAHAPHGTEEVVGERLARLADQEARAGRVLGEAPKPRSPTPSAPAPAPPSPRATSAPTLPDGVNYQHMGGGLSLWVRRAWLASDPQWRSGQPSVAPTRARELLEHLRAIGVIGWATPEAITAAAADTKISTSGAGDVVRLHWSAELYGHIGLPPGAPAAVTIVGSAALVAVSAPDVDTAPGTRLRLGAAHLHALIRALEERTGMTALSELGAAIGQLGGTPAFTATGWRGVFTIRVDEQALEAIFGRPQIDAWREACQTAARGEDATRTTVGKAGRMREHGLPPADAVRIRQWLGKHLKAASGGDDAFLDRAALEAIDRVEAHPHRDRVHAALARLQAQGGARAPVTSWELDALLQQALIEAETEALEIAPRQWRPLAPTFRAPLPARIDQSAGRVIGGELVPFTLRVDFPPAIGAQQDHNFRYRSFQTDVEWIFEKVGDRTRKPEHRHDRFPGSQHRVEHRFALDAGEERATWEVRAHVRHTHFLPAYLTTLVEVKTEEARMTELRDEALGELGPARRGAHDFRTSPYNEGLGGAKYNQGQRLEGALPATFKARTASERAAQRGAERERLEELTKYLTEHGGHGAALRAARWHIERLQEADRVIARDTAAGLVPFEVRGTFLSRQPGVEDGPLDLYGAAHRAERKLTVGGKVDREEKRETGIEVQLRDLSRRFESDVYRFTGWGATFDDALEDAFVALCKAYPPGRVALLAQRLDPLGVAPTGKTLGFELDTGTAWEDTRARYFDPIVRTVITLASVAVMIFIPAAAPMAAAVLVGYNAIEALSEIADASAKGTLTGAKVALNLASIALDVVPLIGRATALAATRAGWFVLEGLDRGGQVALMTASAYSQIHVLQEQQLLGIARAYEAMIALEQSTHPSDPRLVAMRAKLDEDAKRVSGAVYEVLDSLIGEQALVFSASRAFHAAHSAMLTRDMARRAELGAYEHVAGAKPRYDRERGVIVADPRKLDEPTLQRLETERAVHLRELADRVASELGVAPEHVELVLGRDTALAMERDRVTLTYHPGMAPDGALARWRILATEARRRAYRGDGDSGGRDHHAGGDATAPAPDARQPHARTMVPTVAHGESPGARAEREPAFETRAEMVPGSEFRGRRPRDGAEPRAHEPGGAATHVSDAERAAVVAQARTELLDLVHGQGDMTIEAVDAARFTKVEDQNRAEQTFVVAVRSVDGGSVERFTIRLAAGPLEGQTVARTIVNPTQQGHSPTASTPAGAPGHAIRGRYVIQLSEELAPVHIRRAIAHELAEIRANRELAARHEYAGGDALRLDATGTALSPHDRGRLAEIEVLAGELANPATPADRRELARTELTALVEHLGLREGTPGAEARFALASAHLGERARAELGRSRRAVAEGTAAHAELETLRSRARSDEAAQAQAHASRQIDHDMPRTTDEQGRPLDSNALRARAQIAAEARQRKSDATWAQLQELHHAGAGAGGPPLLPFELQIGGGAALAARDRNHLLIDDRGRWQADGNPEIAQTATQTKQTRDAGLGDPTEIVGPNARVPRDAVAHWEDSIAAQGPVVNGRARLRFGNRGELLIEISYKGQTLTFRTDKVPYVATGFVPERVPGMPFQARPTEVAAKVAGVLKDASTEPSLPREVQTAAARAHAALARTPMVTHQDAIQLTTILSDPALRPLHSQDPIAQALKLAGAAKNWRDIVVADNPDHPHVFFGDQANLGREQAHRSNNWTIAGTGGTGISAAEIILSENPKARVTMIGADRPAGLFENDQFRALAGRHADAALATELGIPPGDGRLRVQVDRVGAPIAHDQPHPSATPADLVDESDIPAHLRSRRFYDSNGSLPDPRATAYVAALGRADDYPPLVANLIDQTRRMHGDYYIKALFLDRQYVGYQVTFLQDGQSSGPIEVTGAASRFLPINDAIAHARTPEDVRDLEYVKATLDWDAPAESGNFAGGFAATATQTSKYGAYRNQAAIRNR